MIGGTLVTIHGLWSSAATWEQLNAIWYADEQLRGLRIHPFSYPSPKKPRLPFSATRVPDYDDVAQTLATWYKVRLAEERDIAIVTHSQGGLILQRFLIRMLHDGHGRELARIRSVVMLNCPNSGSEYLRSVRHFLGFRYHPQIGSLKIHDKQVADTQRTVLQRVVNAAGVDDYQCRIPFHVYAGNTDKIVNAASAQGAFPGCSVLAGDHFSVLDPAAPGNSTAETVKYHILTDWATALSQGQRSRFRVPISTSTWPAAEARRSGERLMVDGMDGQGVILDEDAAMQEQQAVRDLSAIQARQDEFARQLASLSEHTRQIEASTTARINVAAAMIMNEVRETNRQLSADTRQLLDEQEKQLDTTLTTERAERRRETDALRSELDHDRAAQVGVLDAARAAVADARVLHNAIGSCLPHERFAPGELARLTDRLVQAEASLAAGTGETALAQSRELYLRLGELRAEVELKDVEWRAAHAAAGAAVAALAQQIMNSSMITVADDELGASAELDIDYWSDGELSAVNAVVDQLAARVNAEADPPGIAELRDISEGSVPALEDRLSEVVATARTRQWASQIRVNVAEMAVDLLEQTTGYIWDGETTFAGDDQREAFYCKLRHPDESEIIVEVAPDGDGKSYVIRVMSYEMGNPDESQRVARARAIADLLREQRLGGTLAIETNEPDPVLRDFTQIRRRQPARRATTRTVPGELGR